MNTRRNARNSCLIGVALLMPAACHRQTLRGPEARAPFLDALNAVTTNTLVNHNQNPPMTIERSNRIRDLKALRARYEVARQVGLPGEATRLRDEIMSSVLVSIRAYHTAVADDVFEKSSEVSLVFDVLGLAANATGTIVGGAETKTVTNAVAGLLIGTKKSLETEFLANNAKTAVLAMMQQERDQQEALLENNLKQPDSIYGLDRALRDAQKFYEAGSLRSSVTALVSIAQKSAGKAASALNEVKSTPAPVGNLSSKLELK